MYHIRWCVGALSLASFCGYDLKRSFFEKNAFAGPELLQCLMATLSVVDFLTN
jgi:hypothetical protein